jgi:hypothetical protein
MTGPVVALVAALITVLALVGAPSAAADEDDSGGNTSGDGGNRDTAAGADQNSVAAAMAAPLVAGTPCTVTARACVDLDSQRAWLFADGAIVRGPVKVSSGGNGKPTPIGHSLRVYRRDAAHKSLESRLPNGQPAPMPWSVFFADGGIAFHSGSPSRSSAGCIHLNDPDAKAWFNYLALSDQVQVVRASQERARHKGQVPVSKKAGKIDPFRGLKSGDALSPPPPPDAADNPDGEDKDRDEDRDDH